LFAQDIAHMPTKVIWSGQCPGVTSFNGRFSGDP
jgi:hypothetical protein